MWNKQEEELQKFAVFLIFEHFDQIHATDTALMDRFIAIWFDVKLMDWKRIYLTFYSWHPRSGLAGDLNDAIRW